MTTIIDHLRDQYASALATAFPSLEDAAGFVEVTQSTQEKFGHYQCNSAMRLAKTLKMPPRAIAEMILQEVESPMILKQEIAGPGFINVTLSPTYLSMQANKMLRDRRLGVPKAGPSRLVIDFSSPNIAKEMHVGHLRSTIIGDAIARLMEFLGYNVLRLNHVGDWGTAFGMLIAHMKEEVPQVFEGKKEATLVELVQWYKRAKLRFDEDAAFKKRAQLAVVDLQAGDGPARKAWRVICTISSKAYREIYDLLNVEIEDRGESFYNPMLASVVEDLETKGVARESDGASCIFLEGFKNRKGNPLPFMIRKSDGGYNYATTDLATLKHRIQEEKAERIIYVTDQGQAQHFAMLFQAAEKWGILDSDQVRVDHVPFGLVLGPDGKKFKTRSGETEKLMDLLQEAVNRARKVAKEHNPELKGESLEELARIVGIGAVKYADLSCNRCSDYSFSYERMLRFEGNTAVFLLYAFVRIQGIKRKVGIDPSILLENHKIKLEHSSEIALGLHVCQLSETLLRMSDDLLPSRLSDFLYELAEKFNAFFRDCRVEGSDEQNSRLLLVELTSRVLKLGLNLLGVQTVERM